MAALVLELTGSERYARRPQTFTEVKLIFPRALYNEVWGKGNQEDSSSKGKAKANDRDLQLQKFFEDAQVSEDDLREQLKLYKEAVKPTKASGIQRPDRDSLNIAERICAVTACPWPASDKNLFRDMSFFCQVGVLEYYMLNAIQYRQPLLPSALGEVRNGFHAILDPCVEQRSVIDPVSGDAVTVDTWTFLDGLQTPPDAAAKQVDVKAFLTRSVRVDAEHANNTYLVNLRKKVENHPSAWARAEDPDVPSTARKIDAQVAHFLNGLLGALYTNTQREVQRTSDGAFTEYFLGDERPPPPGISTSRRIALEDTKTSPNVCSSN